MITFFFQASTAARNTNPAVSQLRHDADVAAVRAMAKLLERLRLQPLDISAGDDATNAVSRRYLRYQQRFIEMLASSVNTTVCIDHFSFQTHTDCNVRLRRKKNHTILMRTS